MGPSFVVSVYVEYVIEYNKSSGFPSLSGVVVKSANSRQCLGGHRLLLENIASSLHCHVLSSVH